MNEAAFHNFFLSRGYTEDLYLQVKPAVDRILPVAESDWDRFLKSPSDRNRMLYDLVSPAFPIELLIPSAECLARFFPYERFWGLRTGESVSEPSPEPKPEPLPPESPPPVLKSAKVRKPAYVGQPDPAPYPSDENIARALAELRASPVFQQTDRLRQNLFRDLCPMNNDSDRVLQKLDFVANHYGVRITGKKALALSITYESAVIDDCIYNGLDPAVEKLLGHSPLAGYELATRYCWCHRPDLFSLMTRRCLRAMRYYWETYEKGHFLDRDVADYYGYKQVLDHFLAVYDVRDFGRVSISLFLDTVGKALEEREK